jgi:hypothetical protein
VPGLRAIATGPDDFLSPNVLCDAPIRVAIRFEISGHRTRAIFDRYNIVSGNDLDDATARRAAYEAKMSKAALVLLEVSGHVDDELNGSAGLVYVDGHIAGGTELDDGVVGASLSGAPVH